MKNLSIPLGLLLLTLLLAPKVAAQMGAPVSKSFDLDGQSVTVRLAVFNPPTPIKPDGSMTNQSSPVHCSHLFYSLLAKGDLEGASKVSNDPGKTGAKWTRQRDRLGEAEFKSMVAGYFSGKVTLKYLFSLGGSQMLVVHDEEMEEDMAQFYTGDGKTFVIDEKESREKEQLGRLFTKLKGDDGRLDVK